MTPTGETVVIDPMIKELMESAAIGEAAKLFLQSELGGHIARRAAEEVEAATARLIEADPADISLIAEETAQGMHEAEDELDRLSQSAAKLAGLIEGLRRESSAALPG